MIRRFIYRFGWDTRCRNRDVTRILKPFLTETPILLDVGCGEYGLAESVRPAQVIGVDIIKESYETADNLKFVSGSVIALPFYDHSFPIVASVDMLEHLPENLREQAINELFRVASKAIIIGFPCGDNARSIDSEFKQRLKKANQPEPEWLVEHLQNPYPNLKTILAIVNRVAAERKKTIKTEVYYSENLKVTRLLRRFATQWKLFYILMNVLAGMLLANSKPTENNSYRAILVTEII